MQLRKRHFQPIHAQVPIKYSEGVNRSVLRIFLFRLHSLRFGNYTTDQHSLSTKSGGRGYALCPPRKGG